MENWNSVKNKTNNFLNLILVYKLFWDVIYKFYNFMWLRLFASTLQIYKFY